MLEEQVIHLLLVHLKEIQVEKVMTVQLHLQLVGAAEVLEQPDHLILLQVFLCLGVVLVV